MWPCSHRALHPTSGSSHRRSCVAALTDAPQRQWTLAAARRRENVNLLRGGVARLARYDKWTPPSTSFVSGPTVGRFGPLDSSARSRTAPRSRGRSLHGSRTSGPSASTLSRYSTSRHCAMQRISHSMSLSDYSRGMAQKPNARPSCFRQRKAYSSASTRASVNSSTSATYDSTRSYRTVIHGGHSSLRCFVPSPNFLAGGDSSAAMQSRGATCTRPWSCPRERRYRHASSFADERLVGTGVGSGLHMLYGSRPRPPENHGHSECTRCSKSVELTWRDFEGERLDDRLG